MSNNYLEFLETKRPHAHKIGPRVNPDQLEGNLFEWQARIVAWALHVGRAAIWADTGLGKTRMMLVWAHNIADTSLIVAPLAVCAQTVREATTIGINATQIRTSGEVSGPGVYVTNYEQAVKLDPTIFGAVVLDEASVLKNATGKMRNALIERFAATHFKLTCTATPAPNDPEELTSQSEFLGQMRRERMLGAYFQHIQKNKGPNSNGWRLKGHARAPMIKWLSEWALAIRRPSDIGGSDDGYNLAGLNIIGEIVESGIVDDDALFGATISGVTGRASARRKTIKPRCVRAAELVADKPSEQWLIWAGLNREAELLTRLIPDAVNVHGSMSPDEKANNLLAFADNNIRVLVTKPDIAAMGMNFQNCANMIFVGLSDSYEKYYQAIRRCYRFGQTRPVNAHIVVADIEAPIVENIRRKETQSNALVTDMITIMKEHTNARRGQAA